MKFKDNNSDDNKKNVIIITRYLDSNTKLRSISDTKLKLYNINTVLNILTIKLTIKLTVNHVKSTLMNLLIDLEAITHIIVNRKIFTQFNTRISFYQTRSD